MKKDGQEASCVSLYDQVTSRIIAELEAGRVPWVQPWDKAGLAAGLARTLSRERAKDMASDYTPEQAFAERRGIGVRERMAEIVRKTPDALRSILDELGVPRQMPPHARNKPGLEAGLERSSRNIDRQLQDDPQAAARRLRTDALKRHARAVDDVFAAQRDGGQASPEKHRKLADARREFEAVRPHGSRDAEAAYLKDPSIAADAAAGRVNRAIRALQVETEIRLDPAKRADRFVKRRQDLDALSERQYRTGDVTGQHATRAAMGDMAKALLRDPQLESILAGRKQQLGIAIEVGGSLGQQLAFNHGIDLGRGRELGL